MAAAVSHRGQTSPDRGGDAFDDFARFQGGGGGPAGPAGQPVNPNDNDEYYDDDEDDDMNFEPQNGYGDGDDDDMEFEEGPEIEVKKKKKERKPREPMRLPKVDLKAKLSAMNDKVKKARMPSPHELREGYLNSSFHRSFQQPLAVRTREMGDPEELEQRQELVKTKSPTELAQINSLADFPVPTPIKNLLSPAERAKKAEEKKKSAEAEEDPDAGKAWGMYGTLPRSMRETKLLTNCREMVDEDQLKLRQQMVQTKSPTELSEIRGLADLPIPTKLENLFKKPRSRSNSISKEKRTRSESLPRTFSGTMYGTLPKSWRQQNIVTQVKVEDDPEVLEKRRALVSAKSPAELAQISSISDLPIPTALEKYIKKPKADNETETDHAASETQQPSLAARFRNLDSMYDSLPRSLKTEVLVRTKVETDEEVLKKRQQLVETKKPAELSQITSLSDFPLPTPIENIFKAAEAKQETEEGGEEKISKRKRNLTAGAIFSYDALPESLKTEVLVRTKVEEDPEVLKERQETVKTKSPAELSQIHGFEDFPLPQKIETLVRPKRNLKSTKDKEEMTAKSKSWSSLPSKASLYDALPDSLKSEVLVRARVETPEVQAERAETVKTKTVAELSQINSLAEFPLPKPIENLIHTDLKMEKLFERPGSEAGSEPKSFRENMYDTLPRSLKSDLLVRVRDEDPEVQRQRQELTRAKSPTELSQINSLSEFPIPTTLENLMKKKSPEPPKEDEPVPPPRRFKKEALYESLPESLKTEVLVRTKVETDEKVLLQRQELCRSKSPAELSEIHDFKEFPVPTFVENIGKKLTEKKPEVADGEGEAKPETKKTLYDTLPASLKTDLLVRAKVEDPEKQRQRAETVKSKSVNELSQITSLADLPLPATIENLIQRGPRPVERKKRFREKQRSLSAKNLQERMYDTLPKSLKSEVLVKSKVEDPDKREERRRLTQSKSVGELSQIHSLSDFPIPAPIEKLIAKARPDPSASTTDASLKCQTPIPTPAQMKENIYASLPRSLKSEVLVRTRVEDPDVLRERQKVATSKSVSELSQMKSISDFPIPTTIENLIQQAKALKEAKQEEGAEGGVTPVPRSRSSPAAGAYDIYASLPRSLKQEVMVRSKIEEDEDLVRKRQALIESKTPAELSQINSFSEIPLPKRIEDWLHHSEATGDEPVQRQSRSFHELRSSVYETLPRSLKEPTLVRTKVEDPDVQRERFELTRSKTPSQLAEMHSIADIPIPGLWERGREPSKSSRSRKGERSLSIPKSTQEFKEIVYNKMMPEALTKPCVVRCKVEDPDVLLRRQEVQQSKSIHELSKIRNLNEFPLPMNLKLPDLPLPSAKKMLKMLARTPGARKPAGAKTNGAEAEISPASTPRTQDRTYTDDEMLRFDAGSPDSVTHREQDFGYEVIEQDIEPAPMQHFDKVPERFLEDLKPAQQQHQQPQQLQPATHADDDQDEESLAEQYRGTPPLRTKKKKQAHRYSHEIAEQVQVVDEPPPLPPKRPSGAGTAGRGKQRPESGEFDAVRVSPQQQPEERRNRLLDADVEPREISEENLGSNEMLFCLAVEPEEAAAGMAAADRPPVASLRKKHSIGKSSAAQQATLPAAPRIAYSYQNDPKVTPARKTSLTTPPTTTMTTTAATSSAQRDPSEEYEERPPSSSHSIQNRPLPAPPAPTRSLKKGHRRTPSPHAAGLLARSSSASMAEQFHSVASTLDRTLVDSAVERRRAGRHSDPENDDTLADSIVDSMHSCADTLVGNGDDLDDTTLHSCADTLHDSDEEFFSEHVDVRHWRAAELPHDDDDDTPTVSAGSKK